MEVVSIRENFWLMVIRGQRKFQGAASLSYFVVYIKLQSYGFFPRGYWTTSVTQRTCFKHFNGTQTIMNLFVISSSLYTYNLSSLKSNLNFSLIRVEARRSRTHIETRGFCYCCSRFCRSANLQHQPSMAKGLLMEVRQPVT